MNSPKILWSLVLVAALGSGANAAEEHTDEYQIRLATEHWKDRSEACKQFKKWMKELSEKDDAIKFGKRTKKSPKNRKVIRFDTAFTDRSPSGLLAEKGFKVRWRQNIGQDDAKLTFKVNSKTVESLINLNFREERDDHDYSDKLEHDKYLDESRSKWAYSVNCEGEIDPKQFTNLAAVKEWFGKPFEGWEVDSTSKLQQRVEYRWVDKYKNKIQGEKANITLTLTYLTEEDARNGSVEPVKGEVSWKVPTGKYLTESTSLQKSIGGKWGKTK